MKNSTAVQVMPFSALVTSPALPTLLSQAVTSLPTPVEASPTTRRQRGRPLEVSWVHLWMGLLTCALQGMKSYQDWWRLMCSQWVGGFAPVSVTDDALIKRLQQAGLAPLSQLLSTGAALLAPRLAALSATTLAPFATSIVALDAHHLGCGSPSFVLLASFGQRRSRVASRQAGRTLQHPHATMGAGAVPRQRVGQLQSRGALAAG